jgi:DNA-binding CsgD family transcriptional regulator
MSELERGRECHRRGEWEKAYGALSSADHQGALEADDLELLATSAYMLGRDAEYLGALERAHLAHLESGDLPRAVRAIFWLGFRLFMKGDAGQATGWLGRAQRLVEQHAVPCVETGYLLAPVVERHLAANEADEAYATATRAVEIGEHFGDVELAVMAMHQQGRARIRQGRVHEGLALLDEVMVAVVAGRLSPIPTGLMYCSVIDSCQQVYALERATEWTSALTRFCEEQPDMVAFAGACSVHRMELLEISGDWEDAIRRAGVTCSLPCPHQPSVAAAWCRLGDLHRLKGDLANAEQAYLEASRLGCQPHAGLALLRLTQNRPGAALSAMRRALHACSSRVARARLLAAYVEVLLANDLAEEAKAVCAELDELAAELNSASLDGIAAQVHGALELRLGNPEAALSWLHRAMQAWTGLDAPYWFARVRLLMGMAYRDIGDDEGSRLELDAARVAFERLGAVPDLQRVRNLARCGVRGGSQLTARELQVLRLVASGESNKAIAARLCLSERTVERHVSNIFSKLDVRTRAAATARAYEHALL